MGKSSRRRRESAGVGVTRREGTLDRPVIFPDGSVLQGEIFPEAIIRHQEFTGPLPPPALLLDYDTILPGLGERIVRMAESEGGVIATFVVRGNAPPPADTTAGEPASRS